MIGSREALLEEAFERIHTLLSYRRQAFCSQPLRREVSMPQLYILMSLQEHGPATVSELAHLLQISVPSASAIVDRMEEHGFLQRERDEEDRRVVHVQIATRGRQMVEEIMGMKHEQLQTLLGTMTDQEIGDIIRGVEALERALSRQASLTSTTPSLTRTS